MLFQADHAGSLLHDSYCSMALHAQDQPARRMKKIIIATKGALPPFNNLNRWAASLALTSIARRLHRMKVEFANSSPRNADGPFIPAASRRQVHAIIASM